MSTMLIQIFLIVFIGLKLNAAEVESRLVFDDNVYQSQDNEVSDLYLRVTGRASDEKQSGNIYFENYFDKSSLNNLGASYYRKLPVNFNKWEPYGKILLQYYLNSESRLANENINHFAAGADMRRKFQWSKSSLLVTPELLLYRFSGASQRTDFRPSASAELNYQAQSQLLLIAGLSFYFNFSSDSEYRYHKTALFGLGEYKYTSESLFFVRLGFSSTSYPNRYGTTAPIYSNRGRLIGVFDQHESVSSNSISLGYERQLDQNKSVGGSLVMYNQRSVSTFLDYASHSIGAWLTYYF